MVGIFGGRMYYNLSNWYKFIGLFPNNSQNQKYLDEQLQTIGDAAYLPPNNYPISYKLKFYLKIISRTVFFGVEKRKYWRNLKNNYKNYEDQPIGRDLFTLMNRYAFIEQNVIPIMGRSADNDFFVMIYYGILKSKLKKWLNNSDVSSLNFLGSLHKVISARQAVLLSNIAMFIKRDQLAYKYLKNSKYKELDDYLLKSEIKSLLIEYREDFLHRFAEDQKIEVSNPLLKLPNFYELIFSYTKLDGKAISERRDKALVIETQRNEQILKKLKPIQKYIYKTLLWRLRAHLRIREQNRLLRGKAYAYLRELFIEVGSSLKQMDLIEKNEDVYYLEVDEIFKQIDGTGFNDSLKKLVESKREKYNKFRKLKAPSRFITTGLTNQLPKDFFNPSQSLSNNELSFKGTISSPGNIEGKVVVLDKPVIPKVPFDILVVSHTDPGWTPLIALAKGLIVEHGGILSHAAIVTRELGIPSIIGVEDITQHLKDGMKVRINTTKQTVDILSHD
jgi:pyruvate,water dikinase